ncbi:MAG TPA: crotonase/enoyl-CoA hydratase family protein [Pseudolabrys sp.]|jgi:enoyl-CoA hydratase/carnithine racemase
MTDFVKLDKHDGIAIATLNSPDTRNTLSSEKEYAAIEAVCHDIQRDKSVRAAIFTGAGKAFCAGGNIKDMDERAKSGVIPPVEERYAYKEGIHRIPLALHNLEVPTIAAVNGPAIGAGLDLACMCDMRIASHKAIFAESFVKIGIIPGDGGAWLLQRIVGVSKAAEMTFTGDPIDANEALTCGLVSKVVSPETLLDEALNLATRIAANPGHQLRMAKRLIREAQTSRLETILEMSAAFQALAHSTQEHHALIAQAVERISKKGS